MWIESFLVSIAANPSTEQVKFNFSGYIILCVLSEQESLLPNIIF